MTTLSPSQQSTIREMSARLCSYREIAGAVSAHPSMVRRFVQANGLPRREKNMAILIPAAVKQRVLERLMRGDAPGVIVREEGVARGTVKLWREKACLDGSVQRYTAEEDATLRRELAAGKRWQDISLPGRTPRSIQARVALLGFVAKNARSPETVERIRTMAADGMSNPKIGAVLGLSPSGVKAIRKKFGIPAHVGTRPKGIVAKPPPPAPRPAQKPIRAAQRAPDAPTMIKVGLAEAWRWWQMQGRVGRPDIGMINDLRRKQHRAPFALMAGKLTAGGKT